MTPLGFYWSLLVSQFVDTKRKDFWQMCTHHVITIILLSFSWICNMHRIGSVLLVVHDFVDAILDVSILDVSLWSPGPYSPYYCIRALTADEGAEICRFLRVLYGPWGFIPQGSRDMLISTGLKSFLHRKILQFRYVRFCAEIFKVREFFSKD